MDRCTSMAAGALWGAFFLGACTPTKGVWEVECGTAPAFELHLSKSTRGKPSSRDEVYGEAVFHGSEGQEAFPVRSLYAKPIEEGELALELELPDTNVELTGELVGGSWEGECELPSDWLGDLLGVVAGAICMRCDWGVDFFGSGGSTSDLEGPLYAQRIGGLP